MLSIKQQDLIWNHAVCNGERQKENLDVSISEAISLLIKVKCRFTLSLLKKCVNVCLCV